MNHVRIYVLSITVLFTIQQNPPLPEGDIFVTGGGNRWKNVIHAHGPRWRNYIGDNLRKQQCKDILTEVIYKCLKKAAELEHESVAVPFVSSGRLIFMSAHIF